MPGTSLVLSVVLRGTRPHNVVSGGYSWHSGCMAVPEGLT